MPRTLKRVFKYKCQEVLCNTVHRNDKWLEHCRKKHSYKFKNNIEIKYKVIETKEDGRPWTPYVETNESTTTSTKTTSEAEERMDLDVDPRVSSNSSNLSQSENAMISLPNPTTPKSSSDSNDLRLPLPAPTDTNTKNPIQFDILTATIQNFPETSDPACFSNVKLSSEDINIALKLENQDLSGTEFPTTRGRKYNPLIWKTFSLPDGSTRQRNWLVYSKRLDAVFCLHCTLFCLPADRSIWSTTGYRGWIDHHGERDVELHEKSKGHLSSQLTRIQWISQQRIDSKLSEQNDKFVQHNREVFKVLIDCCRYLSEEMLAFRKKDAVEGKLMNLFKVLSKYSPDARIYLEKIEKARESKNKLGSNFLSYRNIFDLVNLMSSMVVSRIVENVTQCTSYSIILDSTQDVSKKECTAILVRYVEHSDAYGNPKNNVKPEERLVHVFTSGDTTGTFLSSKLLDVLQSLGISLNGMVGQSLDGAGNMRGNCKGLKSLILKECPRAFYVWCCSHRFSLVVEKSMDVCPQMRNMFYSLQELYVFFSGHRRHHIFIENQEKKDTKEKKVRLKRVLTTRWSSKSDSIKTVLTCYDTILKSLEDIVQDKKSDNDTRATANGLVKKLKDFETIATMHVASALFAVLSPVTVCLQSKTIDYGIVSKVILDTKLQLQALRSEEKWGKVANEITKFAYQNDLVLTTEKRQTKRKKFMDEMAIDEPITEPNKKLRVEVYYTVLESLCSQIEDRFPESSLKMINQMCHFSHTGLLKMAEGEGKRLDTSNVDDLCSYYNIDSQDVISELETFSCLYKVAYEEIDISDILHANNSISNSDSEMSCQEDDPSDSPPVNDQQTTSNKKHENEKLVDHWIKQGFIRPYRCVMQLSSFPNLIVIYRILLSLAVTSCSAERTMSRLKIVKSRLRSSMGDKWLSSLLILACEKDIFQAIHNDDIINEFALTTARRKQLLLYKSYKTQTP